MDRIITGSSVVHLKIQSAKPRTNTRWVLDSVGKVLYQSDRSRWVLESTWFPGTLFFQKSGRIEILGTMLFPNSPHYFYLATRRIRDQRWRSFYRSIDHWFKSTREEFGSAPFIVSYSFDQNMLMKKPKKKPCRNWQTDNNLTYFVRQVKVSSSGEKPLYNFFMPMFSRPG